MRHTGAMTRRLPMPRSLRLPGLFAAYGAAALLLFARAIVGDRSFFDFGDSSLQSYPWLLAVARAARHGHLVLWEFGAQAGTSFAGELQPAPFYPPTWLLGLLGLDGIALCDAFVLLHFALAAGFMHLLLRAERASRLAAILGAALFAFCGYLPFQANAQPNIFASLCWLPLVLLLHRRAWAADRARDALPFAALAGLAGALQIAAGHMQPFVHSSYAAMICALVAALALRSVRPLLLAAFGQAMAVGFAAVPIELARQYLELSYRWYATGMSRWPHAVPADAYATAASLTWPDLSGLLHPSTLRMMDGSLYFTVVALPLCALGLLRRTTLSVSMTLLAVFALAAALGGRAGPLVHLFFHLPLLPQLRSPIRAVYLFSFAVAVLAATGLDAVRGLLARLHPGTALAATVALLLAVLVQVAQFDRGVGRPAANPEFAPAYYNRNPALDALLRLSNRSPLVDRYDALPRDLVPPNAGDLLPVLNLMGQRATMLVPLFDDLSRNWGPVASPGLDRLGVRWLLSDHPIDGLPLVEQGPGYRIYERPGALSVLWIDGTGDTPPRRAPVLAADWTANRVRFTLQPLPAGTRLVFAQPSYPGWQARVDGRRTVTGREDIFPAVVLPAGARVLEFAYRPSLLAGKLLTASAFLVLLGSLVPRLASRRRR